MSNSRITDSIPKFNDYINDTDDTLQAISSGTTHNWERLGLTSTNASDWHDKRVYWRDTLYPKYSSPSQSTKIIKANVQVFMKNFRTFGNPLLDVMAASPNATEDDEITFNFKIGRAAAHHSDTPIEGTVLFEAVQQGGGDFRFSCRTGNDGNHASLADGADTVQLAYKFINGGNTPPTPQPGGDDLPTPEDEGMQRDVFTKAIFIFHAGPTKVGKIMVVFARWYNTKHPHLAGPWSQVKVVIVS